MLFLPVVVAICFPMGQKRYLSGMWHCDAVRALVAAERPSLICLQETKRVVSSDVDLKQFIGTGFDYSYLPADGTLVVSWLPGRVQCGLVLVLVLLLGVFLCRSGGATLRVVLSGGFLVFMALLRMGIS
jgi:hypothetical protein